MRFSIKFLTSIEILRLGLSEVLLFHLCPISNLTFRSPFLHLSLSVWVPSASLAANSQDWDLNSGQTTRAYPTHGAQLSSLSLRPFSHPMSPSPSPTRPPNVTDDKDEDDSMGQKPHVSVSVGADFFTPKVTEGETQTTTTSSIIPDHTSPTQQPAPSNLDSTPTGAAGADIEMAEPAPEQVSRASSYDPLFDDEEDAEGETVPPSAMATKAGTPIPTSDSAPVAGPSRLSTLALPGQNGQRANGASTAAPQRSEGAAATIPLLSPTTYKQFSDDVLLASFMDGQVMLVDRRVPDGGDGGIRGVGRLSPGDKAPPWCMSVS